MEINLEKDERIDDLEFKGLKIIQNKNWFCFGIDSVLLSDFAKNIRHNSKVIDLGTGTGIINILLYDFWLLHLFKKGLSHTKIKSKFTFELNR